MNPCRPCCDGVATSDEERLRSCKELANSGGKEGAACAFERRSLLDELSARGVRLTLQRRILIDIIQRAEGHLDVAAILALAKQRDRATVYRTIELLKRLRLIDELDLMHLQGDKHYYEVKTRRDHIHLACFHCGRIEEVSSELLERLKSEVADQLAFDVRVTRLELGGKCRACRQESGEAAGPPAGSAGTP
jgi:Fur family ferric uptake transcriptional regulator